MSSSCDEKIPRIEHHQNKSDVSITICGYWSLNSRERLRLLKRWDSLLLQWKDVLRFEIKCDESLVWDSSLVVFLRNAKKDLSENGCQVVFLDLPLGLHKLLNLADEGQKRNKGHEQDPPSDGFLSMEVILKPLDFLGALVLSFLNLVRGRSVMRWRDFFSSARNCSASALPIVTLISFLTGVTMAFVGSVQLEKFNATIYVADLVSLAMVREMGALMVAIIMAGRTGAAFAAELGNMNLNEEIDSLETFGICSVSFLVLPRTLALFVMTPLLTIYADIVGILGGLLVGTLVMDFSALHYLEQTQSALTNMWEIYSGVSKSLFFGLIIGLVGCYKGVFSGRDSASLGKSVTSAVVISVTLIIVADAFFETAFSLLELR